MKIQLTKQLADTMKVALEAIDEINRDPFFEWHGHVYTFNRRKVVIFMNNATRYPIVFYGLKMAQFKTFDLLFQEAIRETFVLEGINAEQIDAYLKDCQMIHYTKTDNRSILGQIKDFWISISYETEDYMNEETYYLPKLSNWAARIPCCSTRSFPYQSLKLEIDRRYN